MTEPNKFYWKFEFTCTHLLVITPLFMFFWQEYDKAFNMDAYVRGFGFSWKRSRILEEGGLLFECSYTHYFDVLAMRDYVESK